MSWARIALLAMLLGSCNPPPPLPQHREFSGQTMGTTWRVTLVQPSSLDLGPGLQAQLDSLEQTFSHWRADSELSRWNASRSTDWQPVSPHLARVASTALDIARASEGALDVTIAPLIELWGFAPALLPVGQSSSAVVLPNPQSPRQLPSAAQIAAARALTGWQSLEARLDPPALRKLKPMLRINLAALVEGYAADQLATWLSAQGHARCLIDIGGELLARGQNAQDQPWQLGIQDPTGPAGSIVQRLPLTDLALATSGTYRQGFELQGQRYSHVLDPRTGRPIEHPLVSVSVVHAQAMLADAWATTLLVLGPAQGRTLAAKVGLRVIFIEAPRQ